MWWDKDETIKFDYEAVQQAYTAMHKIYDEAADVLEKLEKASETAEEKMKGQYKGAYKDKREAVFKEFKKSIENIEKLSQNVEQTSEDFLEQDMILAESYGTPK